MNGLVYIHAGTVLNGFTVAAMVLGVACVVGLLISVTSRNENALTFATIGGVLTSCLVVMSIGLFIDHTGKQQLIRQIEERANATVVSVDKFDPLSEKGTPLFLRSNEGGNIVGCTLTAKDSGKVNVFCIDMNRSTEKVTIEQALAASSA